MIKILFSFVRWLKILLILILEDCQNFKLKFFLKFFFLNESCISFLIIMLSIEDFFRVHCPIKKVPALDVSLDENIPSNQLFVKKYS